MFNINKTPDTKTAEIKENVSQFVDNTKDNINEVASDIKASAADLGDKLQEKSRETKEEAHNLVDSLKSLLSQYTDGSRASEIKNQLVNKAVELKGVVQDEVTNAYESGKERTAQTVQDKPILSLAVALGAGILVGYILGTKQSSK